MSVTKEGIKGYEYQYKVTVFFALLCDTSCTELFVETRGSEDAFVKLTRNNKTLNIEIQVKGEKGILDIPKLTKWLCYLRLANNTKTTILPIHLSNTYNILPPNKKIPNFQKSNVKIFKPILFNTKIKKNDLSDINQKIFDENFSNSKTF